MGPGAIVKIFLLRGPCVKNALNFKNSKGPYCNLGGAGRVLHGGPHVEIIPTVQDALHPLNRYLLKFQFSRIGFTIVCSLGWCGLILLN